MKAAAAVTLLVALTFAAASVYAGNSHAMDSFDARVGWIVWRVGELESMGWNVSNMMSEVNTAIRYAEKGDLDSANRMLDSVEAGIAEAAPVAEREHTLRMIGEYTVVGLLLASPLAVYIGLPRLYLALWYRARRRWLVEE